MEPLLGVSGAGGAIAVQQAARFAELSGQAVSFSPSSLTQVSEAYSSFGSMGIIPLPSFVSRIPNVNAPIIGRLQTFVLSKFSLPTLSALPKAAAQKAVSPLLPTSGGSGHSSSQQSQLGTFYGQQAYNPSMSGSIGMQPTLIMNPSSWNNDQT